MFNGLAGFSLKDTYGRSLIAFHMPHYIGMVIVILMTSVGLA